MDNSISQITRVQRYLPHTLDTKFHAVSLYRNNHAIAFICRKYKISKASLMRWNKKFDGTKESLIDRSHKPLSPHPSSHTEEELTWIRNYIRRNPRISMTELFGKLKRNKGYSRHPCSLFRVLRKLGFYKQQKEKKKKKYKPQPYDTPKRPGVKWQRDKNGTPIGYFL